jgi:Flp pilus assembly pilin Flp
MQLHLLRTAAALRRGRLDDGQDLLEYALLVSLVVITAIGAVDLLGTTLKTVFWDAIAASNF